MKAIMMVLGAIALALVLPNPAAYATSCADDTTCTIDLSNTNVPPIAIDVKVKIDNTGATTVLTFWFDSANISNPVIGIDFFAYNDDNRVSGNAIAPTSASPGSWKFDLSPPTKTVTADGFGNFNVKGQDSGGTNGTSSSDPISFTLANLVTDFPANTPNGAEFAAHVRFESATTCSGWVSDGTWSGTSGDVTTGCTKVPEPSVLLFVGVGLVAVGMWGRKRLSNRNV